MKIAVLFAITLVLTAIAPASLAGPLDEECYAGTREFESKKLTEKWADRTNDGAGVWYWVSLGVADQRASARAGPSIEIPFLGEDDEVDGVTTTHTCLPRVILDCILEEIATGNREVNCLGIEDPADTICRTKALSSCEVGRGMEIEEARFQSSSFTP